MSYRLTVLMDETWPTQPRCPWVLTNTQGQTLQQGESDPRHWPASDVLEVILTATQCVWQTIQLPKTSRREEVRLIAYALEDQLVKETETQHFTPTDRHTTATGVAVSVITISQARLRALLAQFQALGRLPDRFLAEQQITPFDAAHPTHWHLALIHPATAVLRTGPSTTITLDTAALPVLLAQLFARARAANTPPTHLICHAAAGVSLPEGLPALCGTQNVPFTPPASPYSWWENTHRATNLLHGDFIGKRTANHWARFKWPAWIALFSLLALLLFNVGEVLWLRHQMADTQTRMRRLFETAVPNTPPINPAAQLTQALEALKNTQGQLTPNDLLYLWAAYAQAQGPQATESLRGFEFTPGRLEMTLTNLPENELTALITQLTQQGLQVTITQRTPLKLTLTRNTTL